MRGTILMIIPSVKVKHGEFSALWQQTEDCVPLLRFLLRQIAAAAWSSRWHGGRCSTVHRRSAA